MERAWSKDPRLQAMPPEKLSLFEEMAERIENAPAAQKMAAFLMLKKEMAQKGLSFSGEETELLFSVFTESLPPKEKKQAQMLKGMLHSF